MIGKIMIDGWKEIEAVLDKYKVSEKDKEKILDAYKAICWEWNEAEAAFEIHTEILTADAEMIERILRVERENWPDEWSVCRNNDYCEL